MLSCPFTSRGFCVVDCAMIAEDSRPLEIWLEFSICLAKIVLFF
jgi:hypothetical protein